jgi:hypothetical protein
VLDANILIRAVLGNRVRSIIEAYCESVSFFVPETAYHEAETHLATLVTARGGQPDKAIALLRSLTGLVDLIGIEIYGGFEAEARDPSLPAIPMIGPSWLLRSL